MAALSGATACCQPALTIYNQNFAVVRDTVPLNLKPGVNTIEFPVQVKPGEEKTLTDTVHYSW